MSEDLIEFLRARLDEDETVAAAALESDRHFEGMGMPIAEPGDAAIAEHLAHWNPVRMAAEVAAKRAILDLHSKPERLSFGAYCSECGCIDCCEVAYPCATLRALAQPYTSHPDFPGATP